MKPQTAEKILTILFRLNAILLTSALLTVFLPSSLMHQIHEWLGMGEMPQDEITEYLARSCSMLYTVHGLVLLVVSLNIRKYWNIIPLLAGLHLAMGVFLLGIDIKAGMPWYWTIAEGPGIIIFACALFWFWSKANVGDQELSAR